MKRLALVALLSSGLAACEGEPPQHANANATGLPYRIAAPADAVYDLPCRFAAVNIPGEGPANSLDLSGTGPQSGRFPTDNARCSLTQTAGSGPVTLTITKNGAHTATVSGPGSTAAVAVF